MATYVQRWQALGEALLGQPATAQQLTRLGDAIAAAVYPGPVDSKPYAEMTNAEKAEFALKYVRQYMIGLVKQMDSSAAIAAANEAAAAIDTEFTEAP